MRTKKSQSKERQSDFSSFDWVVKDQCTQLCSVVKRPILKLKTLSEQLSVSLSFLLTLVAANVKEMHQTQLQKIQVSCTTRPTLMTLPTARALAIAAAAM